MKPAVFHPDARAEFEAAVDYYETRRLELGIALADEVEETVWLIRQSPGRWARSGFAGARRCSLKRFPYSIYYLDQDERIWIVAIAHQMRRPFYWAARVPDN